MDRLHKSEDRSRFPVTRDSFLSALCSLQSVSVELAKSCGLVSGVNSLYRTVVLVGALVGKQMCLSFNGEATVSQDLIWQKWLCSLWPPTSIGVAIEEGAVPQPCTGCRVQTSAGYSVTSPAVCESNVCDVETCERHSNFLCVWTVSLCGFEWCGHNICAVCGPTASVWAMWNLKLL
jgi:hypothetical protein